MAEAAFWAVLRGDDRSIRHARVYCLVFLHVSLPSITSLDNLGLFANGTPVRMATRLG